MTPVSGDSSRLDLNMILTKMFINTFYVIIFILNVLLLLAIANVPQ